MPLRNVNFVTKSDFCSSKVLKYQREVSFEMPLNTTLYDLVNKQVPILPEGKQPGNKLVHPENSRTATEVKSYPLLRREYVFAIYWQMSSRGTLNATLIPWPERFRYKIRYGSEMKTQLHVHGYLELAYVAEGEFTQIIMGKELTFSKGELILIDRNCVHQDKLRPADAKIVFLGISDDMFSEICRENVTTRKLITFLQEALVSRKDTRQYIHFKPLDPEDTALERMLDILLRELANPDAGSGYIKKGVLIRIFRLLSTRYDFALTRDQKKEMQTIIYGEIISYINRNCANVTIRDLTETFHFQEDYFNRLLKQRTGLTYSAYVQKVRIEKAASLLVTSSKTIDAIAAEVGYNNRGFFNKLFTARYGMTASQYRKGQKLKQ